MSRIHSIEQVLDLSSGLNSTNMTLYASSMKYSKTLRSVYVSGV